MLALHVSVGRIDIIRLIGDTVIGIIEMMYQQRGIARVETIGIEGLGIALRTATEMNTDEGIQTQ